MTSRLLLPLFLALAAFLSGCAGGPASLSSSSSRERFAGHWTMGAAGSVFTTTDGRNYPILSKGMPMGAYQFLSNQPAIVSSGGGELWCVYMEVTGRLLPLRPGGRGDGPGEMHLQAEEILRMEAGRPEFVANLRR